MKTASHPIKLKAEIYFPLFVFLMGAVFFAVTDWDLSINDFFFDFEMGAWRYGDSWWANQLIHQGGNLLVKVTAVTAVLTLGLSLIIPKLRAWRRAALFILLVIGFGTGLVALGKQTTNMDCPYQLERYDGDRPYYSLFEAKPKTVQKGKCFPGGHSSGAFSFIFLYFLLRERGNRKLMLLGLGFALTLGGIFAIGQWARGAHTPSHDWYSFFICYFSALMLYRFAFKSRLLQGSLYSKTSIYPHVENSLTHR